jgi:hypothetical protein
VVRGFLIKEKVKDCLKTEGVSKERNVVSKRFKKCLRDNGDDEVRFSNYKI